MATLTYWVAECNFDHKAYSIVGKTRKEVLEKVASMYNPEGYDAPVKK